MFTRRTLSAARHFGVTASTLVSILGEHASPPSGANIVEFERGRLFLDMVDKGCYFMEHPAHVPTVDEEDSILAYRFALKALCIDRCDDRFRDDLLRRMEVLWLLIEFKKSPVPVSVNDIQLTRSFFERVGVCTAEFLAKNSCVTGSASIEATGQHHC